MDDQAFSYETWAVSHKGNVRDLNEDRYLVEAQSGLWLVADGMGGYDAGEVASAGIVERLKTIGVSTSAVDQEARFVDRLSKANSDLQDYSRQRAGATIGATVAALLIFEGEYRCLWLGDSRVYLIRRGRLEQISRDHSEVQELVDRGVLSKEEARTWPGRNVITRAVGVHSEIEPETAIGAVQVGDSFLLCSDGLTAHANDDDILDAVKGRTPRAACELLLDLVLERGATDNVTVVIVQIRDADATVQVDHGAFAATG
jgi:serine/threonine protein phosphatase PrpC